MTPVLSAAERQLLAEHATQAESAGTRLHTRWRVITGAPGSGKTTLAEQLAQRGFRVVDDPARMLLEEALRRGLSAAQVRADYAAFQQQVLQRQLQLVQALDPAADVFFDYCIAESLAFMKLAGLAWTPAFLHAAASLGVLRVYLLAPLALDGASAHDGVRTETQDQRQALHGLIREVYRGLGAALVEVPVLPVPDRLALVLGEAPA
ncbi:MAG: ATP-binding protein [Pseudomonadota bacterium]